MQTMKTTKTTLSLTAIFVGAGLFVIAIMSLVALSTLI